MPQTEVEEYEQLGFPSRKSYMLYKSNMVAYNRSKSLPPRMPNFRKQTMVTIFEGSQETLSSSSRGVDSSYNDLLTSFPVVPSGNFKKKKCPLDDSSLTSVGAPRGELTPVVDEEPNHGGHDRSTVKEIKRRNNYPLACRGSKTITRCNSSPPTSAVVVAAAPGPGMIPPVHSASKNNSRSSDQNNTFDNNSHDHAEDHMKSLSEPVYLVKNGEAVMLASATQIPSTASSRNLLHALQLDNHAPNYVPAPEIMENNHINKEKNDDMDTLSLIHI